MSVLAGKVALITGGSKGIGKASAKALAALGASVAINYASDPASADALVNEIGKEHAFGIQADAGSVEGADKMVKATLERFGRIDILIPNAGLLPMRTIDTTTEEDFDRIYAVNVKGPYFLAQKASPHMAAGSSIIFLSTSVLRLSNPAPDYLLYCTTKGAIEQLTKVLSKDLARKGVSVNCVAPGPTGTELFYRGKSEQVVQHIAGLSPQNRIGTPEEIADVIAFLSSPSSRWVTGQILPVNGGMA